MFMENISISYSEMVRELSSVVVLPSHIHTAASFSTIILAFHVFLSKYRKVADLHLGSQYFDV